MSEKAQAMIDELVAACIEFGRQADPDRLTRLKKARQELHEYIAELEAGAISAGKQEVETKNRLLKERDKKIANLHKVIAKQQLKIQRQAENITTLLHLYTSGKRSKSHKKLREKYRALKARMMSDTHEKEQIKKLLMICGLTLEAIKNLSIKFEELPEWQQAALPNKYKTTQLALLGVGVMLGDLLVEMGVAERISEEEK